MTAVEVPNVYNYSLRRMSFDKTYDQLDTIKRHASITCKSRISVAYIDQAFNEFTHGYVYYDNDIIMGLALLKFELSKHGDNDSKQCHFLLLCADINDIGLGTTICFDVEKYCISHHVYYIYLVPSEHSLIKYYSDRGYKLVLDDFTKKIMSKHLTPPKVKRACRKNRENANAAIMNAEPDLGIL
jgi:hypothetical protein